MDLFIFVDPVALRGGVVGVLGVVGDGGCIYHF